MSLLSKRNPDIDCIQKHKPYKDCTLHSFNHNEINSIFTSNVGMSGIFNSY